MFHLPDVVELFIWGKLTVAPLGEAEERKWPLSKSWWNFGRFTSAHSYQKGSGSFTTASVRRVSSNNNKRISYETIALSHLRAHRL